MLLLPFVAHALADNLPCLKGKGFGIGEAFCPAGVAAPDDKAPVEMLKCSAFALPKVCPAAVALDAD